MKKGKLILLVGASGVGKDTLIDEVKRRGYNVEKLVTYTTRQPRTGEINGKDYNFVSVEEFDRIRNNGDVILGRTIHGNYYAPTFSGIDSILSSGTDCIFTISLDAVDVLLEHYDATVVYLGVPNSSILRNRLMSRSSDTIEQVEKRVKDAILLMQSISSFKNIDYKINSVDVEETADEFCSLVL